MYLLTFTYQINKLKQTQHFHRLKQLKPSLYPDFKLCDFENVAIISIKNNFQDAQINERQNHLTKNSN